MRKPLASNRPRAPVADGESMPAPTGGWDAVSPLSEMEPDRAIVLDNWFPRPSYVEVRKGSKVHASNMGNNTVDSLLVYNGVTAAGSRMFSVTNGEIFDVSSAGNAVATGVTGLASDRWQYTNFATSGGNFLWICSGADDPRHYNGSVWATPTITGITASDVINVNSHKKRLWFILKDSMDAAYLGTDSIAGSATKFPLGSIMGKGGYLVAMATWTKDGGSGPDDLAVFISSRGQVAVYQGTDPASASTWSLVGVYDLGAPIGYRCFTKVAGDLALINIDGVLPISKAYITDRGAADRIAITSNIDNAMNEASRDYRGNFGWELCSYSKGTMALLNVPLVEGNTQHQYVMNTLTGAWCRFKNLNANCWAVFNDDLFFGGNDGLVYQADVGALDVDQPVDAVGQTAYNYFRAKGRLKSWTLLQPLLTTDSNSRPAIGLSTDFADNAVLGTPTSAATNAALFDSAIFDVDIFPTGARNISDWLTVSGQGQAASVHFRSKTGPETGVTLWGFSEWGGDPWSVSASGDVVMKLNGFNAIFERGGFM